MKHTRTIQKDFLSAQYSILAPTLLCIYLLVFDWSILQAVEDSSAANALAALQADLWCMKHIRGEGTLHWLIIAFLHLLWYELVC